jgi:hypothetical protein
MCLIAVAPLASAQTTVAGSTPGSFRVTESGAAEYRIPITVPPGIAGMEPKLALAYNSQAENGLVGVGWHLEGLSAIARCPRTMAQDGVRGGINYDWNDRYCLDGQRLVAISGSYGADGAEYRTERESFSKVISYGVAGNGPASFKVWTKSGQIIEYGNTADSRIPAHGKNAVRLWTVNKVFDTKGNYYSVIYSGHDDTVNPQYQPIRIDYTGNPSASVTPGLSVRFFYEVRPDYIISYMAGSMARMTNRLKHIQMFSGEQFIHEYRLAYHASTVTARSLIDSIKLCSGDGASCFAPTNVTWQTGTLGPQNFSWDGAQGGPRAGGWWLADLFGDGRKLFYTHDNAGNHFATRVNPDGSYENFTWSGGHGICDTGSGTVADLFGEGRQLYYGHCTYGNHYATRFNPDGTLQNYSWNGGHGICDLGSETVADLFGEGRQLYYGHCSHGNHFATRLNPDGTLQNYSWNGGHGICDLGPGTVADLFGEGRQLYYGHCTSGNHFATRLNPDGTLQNYSWDGGHGICNLGAGTVADLFGEGRQLYYGHCTYGNHYATRLNPDGTHQNYSWDGGHGICDTGAGTVADLFGEGRQLYYGHCTYGNHYATRLNPDGTHENYSWNQGHGICNGGWDVGDLFGDGRVSYWGFCNHPNHFLTRFSTQASDLVSSIADGNSATVFYSYLPLTSATVYTKDNGSTYPTMDVKAPLFVVASTSSDNGVGSTRASNYQYGGLKVEAGTGRGSLGFRWMEMADQSTGLKLRNEHRQDWPFVGMPSIVKRTQPSGAVLSQVTNTFSCTNPASGGACTVAAGNRYFPFLSQIVETGNDLNSAALPTVTTTNSGFDLYGNVGTISVSTGDGYSKTTTSIYTNDVPNWLLGRLKSSTVQSTVPAP